jgi:hypothetical protein
MESLFSYIEDFVNYKTIVITGRTVQEQTSFLMKNKKSPKTDIAFSTLKMWMHMAAKTIIIIIIFIAMVM